MYFVKFWIVYPVSIYVRERVVMKLILISSTQFGKFFPNFMLPLLYKGYCIEFIMFWKRVGGTGNPIKTIAWLSKF